MVSLLVCMATFFVFVCIFATRCSVHAFLAIKIMSIYPPVHLSVCLSVACGLCDKTKEPTADILNTCERAMPVDYSQVTQAHLGLYTTGKGKRRRKDCKGLMLCLQQHFKMRC